MIETRQFSSLDIAAALGAPAPTAQQRSVIEAPLTPALVIAGAGSGKTETMANRVLWLLANGLVRQDQVLGLTFTRKAAGELAARIRTRIAQLAAVDGLEVDALAGHDPLQAPTVSTYNAFANAIFRDNALLIGRDSDGAVLGAAAAWQLARSIVVASGDERLVVLDRSVDTVTNAVLALDAVLAENLVGHDEVRAFVADFIGIADLPGSGRYVYGEVDALAGAVGSLDVVLDLAVEFARAKSRRGLVEFSDQVALALRIVRSATRVGEEFRDRYRVVLLDEYQDTSVSQTRLLAELFQGQAVMAVGDPNQSIYGWRGASAANLDQFATQFGGGTAETFTLATSWRNGHGILAVANALVEPLVASTRIPVARLDASPVATALPVEVAFEETVIDEADTVAAWLKQRLAEPTESGAPPSAALLLRARKTQPHFLEALRRHGVPFHVLGVGGLLTEPEIADLVCALAVLNDPSAGSELIRLLAGSRWRIGVRDLRALKELASWLRRRDYAQRPFDDEVQQRLRDSVAEGEAGSIVDALDFVASARPEHSQLAGFSPQGLERLRDAGRLFARLRSRAGVDLLDYVTLVEQELVLDIEVIANDARPFGGSTREAFVDALAGYVAVADSASLSGFLSWLREAEWRDGLAPRPEDPEPGTVQVLTIHAAKGLEWDAVAVPRFVEDELPSKPKDGTTAWLRFGMLPWEFRGDAAELPEFAWRAAQTRKELLDEKRAFAERVGEHHRREERRLAYVAVTRARHWLLLSGSWWTGTVRAARGPSMFLRELENASVISPLPTAPQNDMTPLGEDDETIVWPMDPLGSRRTRVEAAAAAVRAADPGTPGRYGRELELLLRERDARRATGRLVDLPARVPASRFKEFVTDPSAVATALRRPMPERPYRATRLGTLFHSWVENRSGVGGATEVLDSLPTDLDFDEAVLGADVLGDDTLAALQRTFERSRWAALAPVEVEREIHLLLDGQIVICKIDAVYAYGDRYEVVDWKTGKAPRDAADLEAKQLQLALYRLAYSRWKGIDPALIDAVFYYVADDRIITPERLFDEEELVATWRASLGVVG